MRSGDKSGWKVFQEVSSPTCCSELGQLEDQIRLFRARSRQLLKASEDEEGSLSGQPVPVIDCPHREKFFLLPNKMSFF